MTDFELNEEQVKEVSEYLNKHIEDYDLEYISISIKPVEGKTNFYYLRTRTKEKEFNDVSIIMDEANMTQRILMDTTNFIYSEIYK